MWNFRNTESFSDSFSCEMYFNNACFIYNFHHLYSVYRHLKKTNKNDK